MNLLPYVEVLLTGVALGLLLVVLVPNRRRTRIAEEAGRQAAEQVIADLRRDLDLPDTRTTDEIAASIEDKTDQVVAHFRR
jgi:hypothetical protein